MSDLDHETIFRLYGRSPTPENVVGRWMGKLVSNSAVSPVTQIFTYTQDNVGKLQMGYVFAGLLRGVSRVNLTPEQMNMYDYTDWHDEVRIVRDDFMLGKWCSPWTQIPLNYGPSFLSIDQGDDGKGGKTNRFCLRFILRRT